MMLSSCTHNEGDIDIWFGTWRVDKIECAEKSLSEELYDLEETLVYLQFQGDMVTVGCTNQMHDELVDYGTWTEGDGTLDISFPDSSVAYRHILGSMLASSADTFHFTITNRSASDVTLSYYNDTWDEHYTLTLSKQ